MNDVFELKIDPDTFARFTKVEDYISYLSEEFARAKEKQVKEQSIKKLELTEVSILSEIV